MKIVVSICTRDRDRLLDACLTRLAEIEVPEGIQVAVCITVNMESGFEATAALVERHAASFPFRLWLINEPRPGIAHARNRALEEALAGAWTHIAFMDDDAWPERGWLAALSSRLTRRHCAVAGPQIPEFPADAPVSMVRAEIHRERMLDEGSETDWAATNNVLIDLDAVKTAGLRFDERFRMFGEDMFFLRQLCAATAKKILWTNGAKVHEYVVPARLTWRWAVSRAFRYGLTNTAVDVLVDGRTKGARTALKRALSLTTRGAVKAVSSVARRGSPIDPATDIAQGAGYAVGLARAVLAPGRSVA